MDINQQIKEAEYRINGLRSNHHHESAKCMENLVSIISHQATEIDRLNAAHEGFMSDWTSAELEHGEKVQQLEQEIEKFRGLYEDERNTNAAIGVEREMYAKDFSTLKRQLEIAIKALNEIATSNTGLASKLKTMAMKSISEIQEVSRA